MKRGDLWLFVWLASLGIALLMSLSSAKADVILSAKPVVGWLVFCDTHPDDCVAKDKNQKVIVTDQVRRDLLKVTRDVNREFIYQDDLKHYGIPDWWEYPSIDGKGDCEDFALEKKRRLIAMGYPQSALLLAWVTTPPKKKGDKPGDHIVLVIATTSIGLYLDISSENVEWVTDSPYKFRQIQSPTDPKQWVEW